MTNFVVLFRKSLCESEYPEGEPDIVASFNYGFTTKSDDNTYVRGYWETAGKRVLGLKGRVGLHFLEKTIHDFNNQFSNQGCYAVLGEDYK